MEQISTYRELDTIEGSLLWHKIIISPSKFAMCHAHICHDSLVSISKLYSSTCKVEKGAFYGSCVYLEVTMLWPIKVNLYKETKAKWPMSHVMLVGRRWTCHPCQTLYDEDVCKSCEIAILSCTWDLHCTQIMSNFGYVKMTSKSRAFRMRACRPLIGSCTSLNLNPSNLKLYIFEIITESI